MVLAVARGTDADRAFWKRCLEGDDIADGDLEQAIDLLKKYDALSETVERARTYGNNALKALETLPAGAHNDALADAVSFCISRVN